MGSMFDRWSFARKRIPGKLDGTSERSIWSAAKETRLRQCLAGANQNFGLRRECRE